MEPVLNDETARAFTTLVDWAVGQSYADIAPHALRRMALIIADDLAAMVSAQHEPEVARAHARLLERAGPASAAGGAGVASLMREARPRLAVADAALGNALAASWNELDEGYRKAVCHAGLYTLPTLLAIAEGERLSTADTLRAGVLAYEITARFASAWQFPVLKLHPHALFNVVGVVAAIGLARRLPAPLLAAALSSAATLGAVGPFNQAVKGALIRNAWAAAGIANGFQAIEWAELGISGLPGTPNDVYAVALGATPDAQALTRGLGTDWAVASGYHKVNACCQYAHSAIEATQRLLADAPALKGGDGIEAIVVETHRLGIGLDNFAPATSLGAKFSMPHAVAATLVHGDGGPASFDTASIADARIAALRARIELRPFLPERPWPEDRPARIRVRMRDGREHLAECPSAQGGPDRPFEESTLWAKIASLAGTTMPGLAPDMAALHRSCEGEPPPLADPWLARVDRFFAPAGATASGAAEPARATR
ncbi:MAG: MmgE/PrpD family protein [Lautropia sp.]